MNKSIDDFMKNYKYEGLTFDDISLITKYADFLPDEANVSTKFTRNVKLKIPFVSAAMDTVTESNMAIEMARLGGIGVIHKNLSPKAQAEEVRRVKLYLNGVIKSPIVFDQNKTVEEMLDEKDCRGFSFSGFPIVDSNGSLVGITTARDIKFIDNYRVKLKDVMTSNILTAPANTSLQDAYKIMIQNKVGKLPTIDKNGKLVGPL